MYSLTVSQRKKKNKPTYGSKIVGKQQKSTIKSKGETLSVFYENFVVRNIIIQGF